MLDASLMNSSTSSTCVQLASLLSRTPSAAEIESPLPQMPLKPASSAILALRPLCASIRKPSSSPVSSCLSAVRFGRGHASFRGEASRRAPSARRATCGRSDARAAPDIVDSALARLAHAAPGTRRDRRTAARPVAAPAGTSAGRPRDTDLGSDRLLDGPEPDPFVLRVVHLLRHVDEQDRPLQAEGVLEGRAGPVADHQLRLVQGRLLTHVGLDPEAPICRTAAQGRRARSREAANRHRMKAKHAPVTGTEERLDQLGTGRRLDERALAPRRRKHDPSSAAPFRTSLVRLAGRPENGVEPRVAVRHQLLRLQRVDLLGAPDLGFVVRPDQEDRVVGVERSLSIDHVGADHRVEDIDIANRMNRALEMERLEVREGHDHDVGLEESEEGRPRRARAHEERLDPRIRGREHRIIGIRRDVADRAFELLGELLDDRPEVWPVRSALRVEHDLAVRTRQLVEPAKRRPRAQHRAQAHRHRV